MDLFSFVKLKEPKHATIGVRPLREGEQPILEATAGHLTVFGAASGPSAAVLVPWSLCIWKKCRLHLQGA